MAKDKSQTLNEEKEMTIFEHLKELRKVVVVSVIAAIVAFVVILVVGGDYLMGFVLKPLAARGVEVIYIDMSEAFVTEMKICLLAGVIVSFPVVVWQLWLYLKPALYPKERRFISLLFISCLFLFLVGVVFAYYVVLGLAIDFFVMSGGGQATPMISIKSYVKFIYSFVLPFGLMAELPLVVFILTKLGFISHKTLVKSRKYVIFIIFILAGVLTPPDAVSQLLLAIPMIGLYELSVFISRWVKVSKERQKDSDEVESSEDETPTDTAKDSESASQNKEETIDPKTTDQGGEV